MTEQSKSGTGAAGAAPVLPRKTADEILAFDDRPQFDIEVPEWGCTVTCREPDAATIALLSRACRREDGSTDELEFCARLFLEGVTSPRFEPRHLEGLKGKSNAAFTRVVSAIRTGKKNGSSPS